MAKAIFLSLSDVLTHVVKFGIDIYPPISHREEQTRLNIFYDEMRSIQPQLFQKVHASAQEFKVFADFRAPNDEAKRVTVSTFELTARGPVFVYPLKCPPPIGDTAIGSTGGTQRSTDGGETWETRPLPVEPNSNIWSIATHPADPNVVLASSLFGEIYTSGDAGDSWQKLKREFSEIGAMVWVPN